MKAKEKGKRAKANLLDKLSRDLHPKSATILDTINYGKIDAGTYAEINRQNAVEEKSDEVAMMESKLCYESDEAGAFFRSLGFTF